MKILYPTLNIFDMAKVRWQAGITKESNVAAFHCGPFKNRMAS